MPFHPREGWSGRGVRTPVRPVEAAFLPAAGTGLAATRPPADATLAVPPVRRTPAGAVVAPPRPTTR